MGMVNGVNDELKIADEHASFIFNCYTFNKSTIQHIITSSHHPWESANRSLLR